MCLEQKEDNRCLMYPLRFCSFCQNGSFTFISLISKVFLDNLRRVEVLAALAQSKINHPKNLLHVIITSNVISYAF